MKTEMIEAFYPWCPNHETIYTGKWGHIPYGDWIHKQAALIERDKSRIAIIRRCTVHATREISLDVNDVGIGKDRGRAKRYFLGKGHGNQGKPHIPEAV